MDIQFFDSISVPVPLNMIYARLGYKKGKTDIGAAMRKRVDAQIDEAMNIIKLRGSAAMIDIKGIDEARTVLENNIELKSVELARMLNGCGELLFMGSTAGREIVDMIRGKSRVNDMACAVVYDAVASEVVDKAIDWISALYNRRLSRENKRLTRRRYSAGYGDFLLDNQKIICETLMMKKLGVGLTQNYMLVPEKSVTAVSGILKA